VRGLSLCLAPGPSPHLQCPCQGDPQHAGSPKGGSLSPRAGTQCLLLHQFKVHNVTYMDPILRLAASTLKPRVSYSARVQARAQNYNSMWSEWSPSAKWHNGECRGPCRLESLLPTLSLWPISAPG
jgi:hypothetical protein